MKIFPRHSLFQDPIYWTKTVVGSKFKFWSSVFVQFLTGAIVIYVSLKGAIDRYWWIVGRVYDRLSILLSVCPKEAFAGIPEA